jgi:hypothetical protein
MFVAGEPLNAKDDIYLSIHDRRAREALTVALGEDPAGGLRGHFDLVLDADGRFEQAAAIA